MSKTISSKLPAATLAQRIASLSTTDLMFAAKKLAKLTDKASDVACTAILETLESKLSAETFEAFCAEIYS